MRARTPIEFCGSTARSATDHKPTMDMTCVSFGPWMPYALAAVMFAGIAIGFGLRFGLDYAELATYRRIARRDP